MSKKRILIIDDEQAFANLLKKNLEAANYEVILAYSGQEALEKIEYEEVDLIFLDIFLPDIDGFEICRKVKIKPQAKNVPVIFLTGKEFQQRRLSLIVENEFSKSGADDFISKTTDISVILNKVRSFIESK